MTDTEKIQELENALADLRRELDAVKARARALESFNRADAEEAWRKIREANQSENEGPRCGGEPYPDPYGRWVMPL